MTTAAFLHKKDPRAPTGSRKPRAAVSSVPRPRFPPIPKPIYKPVEKNTHRRVHEVEVVVNVDMAGRAQLGYLLEGKSIKKVKQNIAKRRAP